MFGPRITTVFASRWKALWWSVTILATAYCSIPDPDGNASTPADPTALAPTALANDAATRDAVRDLLGDAAPAPPDHPANPPDNPWAKDPR